MDWRELSGGNCLLPFSNGVHVASASKVDEILGQADNSILVRVLILNEEELKLGAWFLLA
jgi:hypothetical protein